MPRMKAVTNGDGTPYGVRWDCPGCGDPHVVPTHMPNSWGHACTLQTSHLRTEMRPYGERPHGEVRGVSWGVGRHQDVERANRRRMWRRARKGERQRSSREIAQSVASLA